MAGVEERGLDAGPAGVSKGGRLRWRNVWLQLHLWLGLIVGFPLALVGLTGALLVFSGPLAQAEFGDTLAPGSAPAEIRSGQAIDAWIATAEAKHPDLRVEVVAAPGSAPLPAAVPLVAGHLDPGQTAGKDDVERHGVLSIDPETGEALGFFVLEESLWGKLLIFHSSLLLPFGPDLVVWASVVLFLSLASGLYLWWPRGRRWHRAFVVAKGARGRRLLRELHNVSAVWLLLPLVCATMTGVFLLRPQWLDPVLTAVSEVREPDLAKLAAAGPAACEGSLSVGAAVTFAIEQHSGSLFRLALIPENPRLPYRIGLMRPGANPRAMHTEVLVDRSCPRLLFSRDVESLSIGETVKSWMTPLHADFGLGVFGKALVFLSGILLPFLYVTGVLLWLRSRRRRRVTD